MWNLLSHFVDNGLWKARKVYLGIEFEILSRCDQYNYFINSCSFTEINYIQLDVEALLPSSTTNLGCPLLGPNSGALPDYHRDNPGQSTINLKFNILLLVNPRMSNQLKNTAIQIMLLSYII